MEGLAAFPKPSEMVQLLKHRSTMDSVYPAAKKPDAQTYHHWHDMCLTLSSPSPIIEKPKDDLSVWTTREIIAKSQALASLQLRTLGAFVAILPDDAVPPEGAAKADFSHYAPLLAFTGTRWKAESTRSQVLSIKRGVLNFLSDG